MNRLFSNPYNEMSVKEKIELDLTDYEQVALEIEVDKRIRRHKEQIATNMLQMNLDIKIVSQATGLTIVELEKF